MALPVNIVNGTGKVAKITPEGAQEIVVHPHPPLDETYPNLAVPFRQYFTDDGTSAGSNDMRVNGGTTAQEFWVTASAEQTIHIRSVAIRVSDTGSVTLAKFGSKTALSNGVEFCHITQDIGETVIHEGIKTNLEFIRLGLSTAGIGGGTTAFEADVSGSGETTYLPVLDLEQTFGMPWGLRLRKGTNDKLVFKIQDDLSTGVTTFNAIAYGIKI